MRILCLLLTALLVQNSFASQLSIGYLHPSDEAKGNEIALSHYSELQELLKSFMQIKYSSLTIDSEASSFKEDSWSVLALTDPASIVNYQLGFDSTKVNSDYSRVGLNTGLHYNYEDIGALHFIGKWARWRFVETSPSAETPQLNAWTGNISLDYDVFWPVSLNLFYETTLFNRNNLNDIDLASLTDPSAGEVYRISGSAYGVGASYISRNWSLGVDLYQSIQVVDNEVVDSYGVRGDYKLLKNFLVNTLVGPDSSYNLGLSYDF